jgi:SAM-dependent methyltransferase
MEIYLVFFLLIILFIYYLYDLYNRTNFIIENFEDKFSQTEVYKDSYDKELVDFYDIIYKDDEYEKEIIKYIEKELEGNNDPDILVVGCGKGSLLNKIKNKYKNTHGLDKSEQMLKKCHENYPYIKTIKANIEREKLFEKNSYDLILFDDNTLNHNNKKAIQNIAKYTKNYLKKDGILFVPVFEQKNLQPRPRYYTTNYYDDKKNMHGFTYINNFSHDCYYIKDDKEGFNLNYYDKIVLKNNNSRIKKTPLYIPEKQDLYEIFLRNGYKIKKIHHYDDFSKIYYEVVILKVGETTINVEENDKEINK